MYVIYEAPKDKLQKVTEILADDLISRQTTSVRDGRTIGMEEDVNYVMVEGSEEAVDKAKELFEEEELKKAESPDDVYDAIKKADEDAAAGVGTIFG